MLLQYQSRVFTLFSHKVHFENFDFTVKPVIGENSLLIQLKEENRFFFTIKLQPNSTNQSMSQFGKTRSILRNLRLQVKVGALKELPWEYDFIRRNPPAVSQFLPESYYVEHKQVPYHHLYKKAMDNDPRYHDEHVMPGHNFNRTEAVTLAKAQYKLMKTGMSEEDAYREAAQHVDKIENDAFVRMKEVIDIIEKGDVNLEQYLVDPSAKQTLASFKEKLSATPYDCLTLSEQGELDKFVHLFVLFWNEIERERRMKDPIFVKYFEKLTTLLFPPNEENKKLQERQQVEDYISHLMEQNGFDSSYRPKNDFFVEDYLGFYNLLKESPRYDLEWATQDRSSFLGWVHDTLNFKRGKTVPNEIVPEWEPTPTYTPQLLSTRMILSFFPMILFPTRTPQLPTITLDLIRKVCFENEIGYKLDPTSGRLYIRRFYKLPQLLFPIEHFCTHLIVAGEAEIEEYLDNQELLAAAVTRAGLPSSSFEEVRKLLLDYKTNRENRKVKENTKSTKEIFNDVVGDIIKEEGADNPFAEMGGLERSFNFSELQQQELQQQIASTELPDSFNLQDLSAKKEEEADNLVEGELREKWTARSNLPAEEKEVPLTPRPDNWDGLLKKYFFLPQNDLQQERLDYFLATHDIDLNDIRTEDQLKALERSRITWNLLQRNELASSYLSKEGARLSSEWSARGVDLADPDLDEVFSYSDPYSWMTRIEKPPKKVTLSKDPLVTAIESL